MMNIPRRIAQVNHLINRSMEDHNEAMKELINCIKFIWNMTQTQISDELNQPQSHISFKLSGKRPWDTSDITTLLLLTNTWIATTSSARFYAIRPYLMQQMMILAEATKRKTKRKIKQVGDA